MWKILGKDSLYIEFAEVWKARIMEIAAGMENGEKFNDLLKPIEVTYLFNGSTEVHSFIVDLPEDTTPEDIQLMADIILKIANDNIDVPFITVEDKYQKCIVMLRSEREPEILGANKTEGYGAGNVFLPIIQSLSSPGRGNDSLY